MTETIHANPMLGFDQAYQIAEPERVLTPALVIYPDFVEANLTTTLRLVNDDARRWRPHVKTAKLAYVMQRYVARGVVNFKCATTLELLTAINAGAQDVLVAYPLVGANARRVRDIARLHPHVRLSVLIENEAQAQTWMGSEIGLFIDVNPGMDRTGIEQQRADEVVRLARAITTNGSVFRGVHYYDGQLGAWEWPEREAVAARGYDQLMKIIASIEQAGINVSEVITAGTPALPCALSYAPFQRAPFLHQVSPGTVVYNDFTSLAQLPAEYGYRAAALVLATVVSHPTASRITCDAGHKTVSADAGVPTCAVLGHPELQPQRPSEEHLPIDVPPPATKPTIGEHLYLVPRHVCPTVNNFDHALLVKDGKVMGVERVTARGREVPLSIGSGQAAD